MKKINFQKKHRFPACLKQVWLFFCKIFVKNVLFFDFFLVQNFSHFCHFCQKCGPPGFPERPPGEIGAIFPAWLFHDSGPTGPDIFRNFPPGKKFAKICKSCKKVYFLKFRYFFENEKCLKYLGSFNEHQKIRKMQIFAILEKCAKRKISRKKNFRNFRKKCRRGTMWAPEGADFLTKMGNFVQKNKFRKKRNFGKCKNVHFANFLC